MDRDETERVYERAGFGAEVHRGIRPALVVVDFSRGFTEARFATGTDLTAEVEGTARLVAIAHEQRVPVLFTVIAYAPHLRDGGAWLEKAPGLGVLQLGSELAELDPRLGAGPDDPVIVKKGASAFFGTPLAAQLAALGTDTVVVCGATTSGCVRASVVDSVQSGFRTLVVRECVGDRAPGPHEANLFDMQAKYADVIGIDDALGYLRGARTGSDVPA